MTKKNDNHLKAISISIIWTAVAICSFKLGFFTLGVAFLAMLATDSIVSA